MAPHSAARTARLAASHAWPGDLAVPYPLGADPMVVLAASLGLEILYMTYAVREFSGLSLWACLSRVIVVLTVGYALLVGVVGATMWRTCCCRPTAERRLSCGVAGW